MKQFVKSIDQYRSTIILLVFMACFCGLLFPAPAAGEKSVADEIISLNVTDKPLGEVLDSISEAAGCQFKIDAVWEDYPITASFKNEPLYRVLKRIFRDFNNAVIYGSDRTIKIIIYDEGTPAGKKGGYSMASKPPEAAVPPAQPYGEATAPQPEVQTPEESSSLENIGQASDENSESISNPAGTEDTEAKEESGEAEPQDKNTAVEAEQNENAPGHESRQTPQAESASDSSETPEKAEAGEESNQN